MSEPRKPSSQCQGNPKCDSPVGLIFGDSATRRDTLYYPAGPRRPAGRNARQAMPDADPAPAKLSEEAFPRLGEVAWRVGPRGNPDLSSYQFLPGALDKARRP